MLNADNGPVKRFFKLMIWKTNFTLKATIEKKLDLAARLKLIFLGDKY